ncbi:cupin domain-containing protein [Chelativorans sp.]|uniref:cupin domain-containing protein n=1 Tax=Chelativorans sp. TaxID=2203393 RepID=UPI00281175DD|nr:cupin domain-containing protein [Chelativorans sp.]
MPPDWYVADKGWQEFWTTERCYITELLNDPSSPEASLAIARVEPGVTTQLHKLAGTSERYILRKGEGIVEVGGQTRPVAVGDQVVIPADVPQRITNTGTGDLEFYCLCVPRFRPDCYVNLE